MRKLVLLLMMVEVTALAHAGRKVTVDELQQVLASAHGKSDARVAQLLSGLELEERLSGEKLSRLQAEMPGPESRRSLVLLADISAFLDPPRSELPLTAMPDIGTQRELITSAVDYATRAAHQLPNFLATRDTIRFEDDPASQRADSSYIAYKPLHAVQRLSATVVYRDGKEVDSEKAQSSQSQPAAQGLITSGEFGPVIGTVLVDAAKGKLTWSHWEKGARGPVAIFRYVVPREESHYEVKFCCVAGESIDGLVARKAGYHGEMSVDPASGSIMRLTLKADFSPADKIVRADIMVEYGPVDIGGQTYICPVKSISISVAPAPPTQALDIANPFAEDAVKRDRSPGLQTKLNDVVFDQYHVFRSEARVLTGEPGSALAAKGEGAASVTGSDMAAQRAELARSADAFTTDIGGPSTAPSSTVAVAGARAAANPAPATPEVTAGDSSKTPEIAVTATAPDSADKSFTLRVTTRLVDVGVVALDKKGKPVTDLKPGEFQIFDNGRRQTLRSFSGPVAALGQHSDTAPSQPAAPRDETVYSNHSAAAEDLQGIARADSGVTILLLDAASLSWRDVSRAREQMLGSLQALPANERVGLYVRNTRRFEILIEPTTDHGHVASILRSWKPTASDLARAQEEEARNRQQFDEVQHVEDLQYANGNVSSSLDSVTAVDPQLRDFGSNPGAVALATLVSIARHLAPTPGRKNLVWVASENVLADWTNQAVSSDKGGKHLGNAVVRAQEALNDAHVSLYPLDASQLETSVVDPSLVNQSVDLSAGVTGPPRPQGGAQKAGRASAELQQDVHAIQGPIQEMAQATGGRDFRRGGDFSANLKSVVDDRAASYLLGFAPDLPADNQYHPLSVKVVSHHGVVLRYRTGYLYSAEPATPRDRFREAVWRPLDSSDIALSARPLQAYTGSAYKLNIAINDLSLQLRGGRWVDKLDIFVVRRGADGSQAQVTGRSLALALLPSTYQSLLGEGIPFEEFVEKDNKTGSLRFLVVDGNSGRMGSLTIPASSTQGMP